MIACVSPDFIVRSTPLRISTLPFQYSLIRVVRGFFNEIITEIGNEEVQERLMERIDGELERAGA